MPRPPCAICGRHAALAFESCSRSSSVIQPGASPVLPTAFPRTRHQEASMRTIMHIGSVAIAAVFALALVIDAADARRGGGGGGMRAGGMGGGMAGGG